MVQLHSRPRRAACDFVARLVGALRLRWDLGFRGRLSNVDVAEDSSVSHINIDKSARIQAEIAGEIGAVAKTK
jgi:hypothetical protein